MEKETPKTVADLAAEKKAVEEASSIGATEVAVGALLANPAKEIRPKLEEIIKMLDGKEEYDRVVYKLQSALSIINEMTV